MDNKDSEIFIDVGLPKTGTTFRQNYIYPKMDVEFYNTPIVKGNLIFKSFNVERKILISDEQISGLYQHRIETKDIKLQRENAVKNIVEWFPSAKIILCTREKTSWINSLYKHYVSEGNTLKKEIWIEKINKDIFDIDGYIKLLKNNFSNVLILRFEDFCTDNNKFIEQISRFIGVKTPIFNIKKINASLSKSQTNTLRNINKICPNRLKPLLRGSIMKINGQF